MGKDYYKILGIAKGASGDEIKNAYIKMALNYAVKTKDSGANSIFKDVAEAYDVLSDSMRRETYDKCGENVLKSLLSGAIDQIFSKDETINRVFNIDLGGSDQSQMQVQDPAVTHEILVSLSDLLSGSAKKIKITKKIMSSDGTLRTEGKVLTIDIKPGWKSGTKVTFSREGDQMPGRVPADIVFVIKQKDHPLFRREGSDLRYTHKLSLREALCGTVIDVLTLEATTFSLKFANVIKPTDMRRIPGQGMPDPKQGGKRGDLIVDFDIQFPESLSSVAKESIQCFLP